MEDKKSNAKVTIVGEVPEGTRNKILDTAKKATEAMLAAQGYKVADSTGSGRNFAKLSSAISNHVVLGECKSYRDMIRALEVSSAGMGEKFNEIINKAILEVTSELLDFLEDRNVNKFRIRVDFENRKILLMLKYKLVIKEIKKRFKGIVEFKKYIKLDAEVMYGKGGRIHVIENCPELSLGTIKEVYESERIVKIRNDRENSNV